MTQKGNLCPALKALALGTFAIHFPALVHVLQSTLPPSNLSPNGYFVTAFIALSASLNVIWLKELFGLRDQNDCNSAAARMEKDDYILQNVHNGCQKIDEELAPSYVQERQQLTSVKSTYLPFYIVGNILLSLSSLSAWEELYEPSHLFVTTNLVVQFLLLYILADDVRNSVITPSNFLTHLVMKTNIGLTILLVWRSWSILSKTEKPSNYQLITIFPALILVTISSGPDPILCLSILFILFSLIFNHDAPSAMVTPSVITWPFTFRLLAVMISACLAIEFTMSKRRNFPWLSGWREASSNQITAT